MGKLEDKQELGMDVGTASNQLRRQLLFSLAEKLDLIVCFQCKEPILNVNEFSVEHKVPWRKSGNAPELFFDLDNISFSHLSCNVAAARKPLKIGGLSKEAIKESKRVWYSEKIKDPAFKKKEQDRKREYMRAYMRERRSRGA